jgi:hypothetical protein
MEMRFFAVPALNPTQAEEEVNRLCTERRVVAVERQFVAAGHDSFWAVCVTLAPGAGTLPDALKTADRRAGNGKAAAAPVGWAEPAKPSFPGKSRRCRVCGGMLGFARAQPSLQGKPSERPVDIRGWVARLSRYRAGVKRIDAALGGDRVSPDEAQRAHDGLLATLAGAETVGFRRRLHADGRDRPPASGYAVDSGYGSTEGRGAPRDPWRLLEQRGQEDAFGLPEREPSGQRERQPGLPSLPELDADGGVEAPPAMDQTACPAHRGAAPGAEPQGSRGAGRRAGGRGVPNAPRAAGHRPP